jgi:hypothetical protein
MFNINHVKIKKYVVLYYYSNYIVNFNNLPEAEFINLKSK